MNDGVRDLLLQLSPSARDELGTVLNRSDRDEIAALLLHDGGGSDDDVIDIFTMYPEARRQAVRILAEMDAEGIGQVALAMVTAHQAAAQRIIEVLGVPAAREFLTLLESNDTIRADAFRQLYEPGDNDALLDSLHDLEADPVVRGWLVEYLKRELG